MNTAVEFDPSPLRRTERMIRVPPVCSVAWTEEDFMKGSYLVEDPDVIFCSFGTWGWTGKYEGDTRRKLYRYRKEMKDFESKEEALSYLEENPLACVGWGDMCAIYWNGKRCIQNKTTERIWVK